MARHFLLPFLLKAKTAEGRPTDFMQHLIEAGLNDKEYMTDSMILSNVTGYGVAASILDPRFTLTSLPLTAIISESSRKEDVDLFFLKCSPKLLTRAIPMTLG